MAIKPLTIKDWNTGIGPSPYIGFGQMVNVDIYSQPGSVLISNLLKRDEGSIGIVDELLKWAVQNPDNGDVYSVDRNGKLYLRDNGTGVWSVITGHGTTGANGEGLTIWNGYLFYARRSRLDVMEISTGTWTNNWQTLESSIGYNLHPILSGQDLHLYIGNGHFVDTVITTLGNLVVNPTQLPFDPTNPITYTYNDPQLSLPTYYRVTCLEELGTNVAIGTRLGSNSNNVADMFFWDGASDSVVRGATIRFADNAVQMTKNSGNTLFTIAGRGVPRLFNSTTAQAIEVKRLNNVTKKISQALSLFPGAIDEKDGEVLMGIGHSAGNAGIRPMGVYSYRTGTYTLRNLISTLNDGSNDNLLIGLIKVISPERYLVSWQDSDNADEFGVDLLSNNFYTEYTAYVESPLYTIGTDDDPTTLEKVEVRMGRKFRTGDGVKVYARKGLDDPWTLVATFDTPNYVGKLTFDKKVSNIAGFVNFQTRIELTTAANATISPELKEVTFQ